jgi:putative hydrolase of the HAD superfamily
VRFFHRAFAAIAEDSNKPADAVETAFWHYNDAVCRGEISIEEFNRILGEKFALPHFEWRDYYLKAVEPITEMQELLKWVSEHYKLGLMSNIMPGLIKMMLEKQFIPYLPYNAIIDSSEVEAIKPEAKIYEIGEQRAGVPAGEILLVDDARANLMAAERQGWHVLWFDDYRPDESAARIREVLEF